MAAALIIFGSVQTVFAADEVGHWKKRCVTDDSSIRTCVVIESVILENLALKTRMQIAVIEIKSVSNSKRLNMYIQVPNNILLQSGLRFQIDAGKTRVSPFTICNEQSCLSEIGLSTDFVNEMKKGSEIKLYFLQNDGKPLKIAIPLIGFTAGFNSKGIELTPEEAGIVPAAAPKPEAKAGDEAPKPLPE